MKKLNQSITIQDHYKNEQEQILKDYISLLK